MVCSPQRSSQGSRDSHDHVCSHRLIGDSQANYWFLAVECFLKEFLVSEKRGQPTNSTEANMWLIKFIEELPHRGSKRAEPRPSICTSYQAGIHPRDPLSLCRWSWFKNNLKVENATMKGAVGSDRRCTSVVEQDNTRVCFVRIHKVEEAAHPVLRVLKRSVPDFHRDIVIVNAGLHYGVGDPGYRCISAPKICK